MTPPLLDLQDVKVLEHISTLLSASLNPRTPPLPELLVMEVKVELRIWTEVLLAGWMKGPDVQVNLLI